MEVVLIIIFCFILPMCMLIKPAYKSIKNKENVKDFFKSSKIEIILVFILILGSFARLYGIGNMPNALNVDEASSGFDAFSLMKYGIDRNGNQFPVVLYAWGSGQSVLYSLITIPFIILGGLTEFTMRAPMAIIGIVSLYVMYYLLKNIFNDKKIALLGTFIFAICPWHIMKSRWGMECNLFPDLVLIAVLLLILGLKEKKKIWQVLSFVILGISAYSYATSYLFLPVFVCTTLVYLIIKKEISIKRAILYLGIVFIISIPLIVYLAVNSFGLEQFSILGITIPKLAANRYEEISTIFSGNIGNIFVNAVDNLLATVRIFILQYDELDWNALNGYGLVYLISLPFFVIGIRETLKKYNKNIFNQIMNIWMISSIVLAAFCKININHINIIVIPYVYYIVLGIYAVINKYELLLPWIISAYALSFIFFGYKYKNQDFNEYFTFTSGIEEVAEYCKNSDAENIYCAYSFKEPFIYFMFYEEYDTNEYLQTVEYFKENGIFDNVKSFGKYNFYLPKDVKEKSIIILPTGSETNYNYKSKITINQFDIYEF